MFGTGEGNASANEFMSYSLENSYGAQSVRLGVARLLLDIYLAFFGALQQLLEGLDSRFKRGDVLYDC